MQTYSLGLGASFFTRKPVQPTQTQTKPYTSLSSHDMVCFAGKSPRTRRDEWEKKCRAIGVSSDEIETIKTQASQDPNVINATNQNKSTYTFNAEIKLLREEYNKRVENASGAYDGAHDSVSESEWN